jgi:hypothetical protein
MTARLESRRASTAATISAGTTMRRWTMARRLRRRGDATPNDATRWRVADQAATLTCGGGSIARKAAGSARLARQYSSPMTASLSGSFSMSPNSASSETTRAD